MRFLYPLGLLGLLAIPFLVIIYIIKSKYTEQTITSTYLWTLSERFLKRKNPINRITGIISLILQIFIVILLSWALAHPVFTLPGKALDYCFILDGSGSMQTVQDGTSRFEAGKERIRDMISSAADGSTFTLITTGNTTDMVMKEVDDKRTALRRLDAVEPAYVASNLSTAAEMATEYLEANPACKFYLITDKTVENTTDVVTVINVAGNVSNYALDGVDWKYDGANTVVTGKAYSYESAANLTIEVFVDGAKTAAAAADLAVTQGDEGVNFSITLPAQQAGEGQDEQQQRLRFDSLTVSIKQKDSLALDNSVTLYSKLADDKSRALIVSNQPNFIEFTLGAYKDGGIPYTVVTPDEYTESENAGTLDKYSGYGLYIFQNYTPKAMPAEGAVWFVNPDTGVDGTSGFSCRSAEILTNPVQLKLNSSSKNKVRNLLKNTDDAEYTYVKEYLRLGTNRDFTTLMYCGGDPVILAGSNTYGNREVVFGIDLIKSSDFAMSYNGRILLYNLIEYTFPSLVDSNKLYCGEPLSVNVLSNCRSIQVVSPSGKEEWLSTSAAIAEYELTEVGEYTVTAVINNGTKQEAKVYSQLPVAERTLNAAESYFTVSGDTSNRKRDGRYGELLYAFIILAVIVVADWAVYCYEQYQLR
ncbi:MAG: BatA and WFA domain-containing protein [Clostridia bacterium]|nr:BatA and WFA domain-containing protein [Clostridia bacterium]